MHRFGIGVVSFDKRNDGNADGGDATIEPRLVFLSVKIVKKRSAWLRVHEPIGEGGIANTDIFYT